MPILRTNGLNIAFERVGDPSAPAILMLMGLGAQLVMWPSSLVTVLTSSGYSVVMMDNRDIGLSEKLHAARAPNPIVQSLRVRLFGRGGAPYQLEDMAEDAVGLMSALQISKFHLIGASMGGMISQIIASKYSERVRSIALISSTTGAPELPAPDLKIMRKMSKPQPAARTRREAIERSLKSFELIGTTDEDHRTNGTRDALMAAYDRCYYPQGQRRQTAAIIESSDLSTYTKSISAPLLALHGSADPLVPCDGGRHAAHLAEKGRYFEIKGMGHDLPRQRIPVIGRELLKNLRIAAQR